jgi:hypothetical protein
VQRRFTRHDAGENGRVRGGALSQHLGHPSILRPDARVHLQGIARVEAESVQRVGRERQLQRLSNAE